MALYSTDVNVVNKNEPPSSEKVLGKLLRKRTKGKALVESYMVLPSTTARVPFVKVLRKRNKIKTKRLQSSNSPIPFDADLDPDVFFISLEEWETTRLPKCCKTKDAVPQTQTESNITIFGPNNEEIPLVEFQEDLSRALYSRRRKVKLLECIDMVYALSVENSHTFPWGHSDIIVDRTFWLTLLGVNEGHIGCLSDKHSDAWFDLMWNFRPADADWAIASSYFYDFFMRDDIPDGSVMETGVITLYDSLGVPDDETRYWWSHMRLAFKTFIPQYLQDWGILEAKCIPLKSYNIKLVVGKGVPIQGHEQITRIRRLCNIPLRQRTGIKAMVVICDPIGLDVLITIWRVILETDIREKDEKSSKNDKTEHEMEEREKVKINPDKVNGQSRSRNQRILNGPT
ncbi:hypothetical protein Tco_1327040 [Tanacetum coccineum]